MAKLPTPENFSANNFFANYDAQMAGLDRDIADLGASIARFEQDNDAFTQAEIDLKNLAAGCVQSQATLSALDQTADGFQHRLDGVGQRINLMDQQIGSMDEQASAADATLLRQIPSFLR